ncbi:hypothetical protein [Promicromonospora sp. NPDC023805]|uniref:hypothetical protein n=1 Tax=Promicromonospora sp. NPDC023805 TaxID=3154696 RepID=UPI0033C6FC4B
MSWAVRLAYVLLAIFVVGMITTGEGYLKSPFLTAVMGLLLVEAVLFVPAILIGIALRKRKEVRAGYTTVTNEFPQVDQIDPKTGRVVRLAGEQTLNQSEYTERMGLIRAAIRK